MSLVHLYLNHAFLPIVSGTRAAGNSHNGAKPR